MKRPLKAYIAYPFILLVCVIGIGLYLFPSAFFFLFYRADYKVKGNWMDKVMDFLCWLPDLLAGPTERWLVHYGFW